jgi:hypothetical protein
MIAPVGASDADGVRKIGVDGRHDVVLVFAFGQELVAQIAHEVGLRG